ncbi:MAG: hypothetical protein JSS69_14890 [Acidobacteria bacterium]|nr:hypothetical protein [Acidobacteriota bacterium]MBS1867198.1 hypothetical protein [Acidobacteriota bacterium]
MAAWRSISSSAVFPFLIFSCLSAAACGAPGEPTPPSPPVPAAITDLAVRQSGDGALLTLTLPTRTVTNERLTEPPAVEIFRGILKPDGKPDNKSFQLVYTLPGALLDTYTAEKHIQFKDPIDAKETAARPGAVYAYRVRTRAAKKKDSADSNTVVVRIFPVPEKVSGLEAKVTEQAVELDWIASKKTSGGAPLDQLTGYRVFRGEIDPATADAAAHDIAQAKWKSPLTLLAPAPESSYRDTLFDFGKTYVYVVRAVALGGDGSVESDDSAPAVVTPRDTFPPAAPQNVVAAVTSPPSGTVAVEISWSVSLESDLAGYRVYRSDSQDARGQILTTELLLAPAYRDISVQAGHRYWYTITAVDRAGNESAPSAISADLTQLSQ